MDKTKGMALNLVKSMIGCALFGLGFNLFLGPNGLNAGGITGLSMVLVHLLGYGTVGTITALLNLPLFAVGGLKIGKEFFAGSLLGMIFSSFFIDLFAGIPAPTTEPLIGALYGGALCGGGLGIVFSTGGSTGGSDIIVRLLKLKWQNVPIGSINIAFDACIAVLTGVVFQDVGRALYSGITILVSGKIMDAVVYRFDYSKVALIITNKHEKVTGKIADELGRGATLLYGEGAYSQRSMKVILTAVKRQQLAELKQLVMEIDPDAFVILQEAHQVLGDGFARYAKGAL